MTIALQSFVSCTETQLHLFMHKYLVTSFNQVIPMNYLNVCTKVFQSYLVICNCSQHALRSTNYIYIAKSNLWK